MSKQQSIPGESLLQTRRRKAPDPRPLLLDFLQKLPTAPGRQESNMANRRQAHVPVNEMGPQPMHVLTRHKLHMVGKKGQSNAARHP